MTVAPGLHRARTDDASGPEVAGQAQVRGGWSVQLSDDQRRHPGRSRRQSSTVRSGKGPVGGGEGRWRLADRVRVVGVAGLATGSRCGSSGSQVLWQSGPGAGRRVRAWVGMPTGASVSASGVVELVGGVRGPRSRRGVGRPGWQVSWPWVKVACRRSEAVAPGRDSAANGLRRATASGSAGVPEWAAVGGGRVAGVWSGRCQASG